VHPEPAAPAARPWLARSAARVYPTGIMSFSERSGIAPARPLQRGSMDGPLRNRLWNAVHELLQCIEVSHAAFLRLASGGPSPIQSFLERVWVDFRGGARDMFPYGDPVATRPSGRRPCSEPPNLSGALTRAFDVERSKVSRNDATESRIAGIAKPT
jgi:hypothetical protein